MSFTRRVTIRVLLSLLGTYSLIAPDAYSKEPQELQKASSIAQLRKHAESGDTRAMVMLGERYRDAIPPDFEQALNWFRKASNQGSSRAMDGLGGMYRDGLGVDRDYAIAREWYQKAVDAGDLTAMASMGWIYFHGLGVKKDIPEALKWYRTAAEKGGTEGMNNLGHLYLNGLGVDQDVQEAIRWFQGSAKNGNPYGYDNLGVLYLEGRGFPKDVESAKKMFRSAAKLGLDDSMIRLGRLERATDTPESRKAAFHWFYAARGSLEGMTELGDSYFDGIGVEPNSEEGLKWYHRAIAARHPFAPARLADRFLLGRGISQDREQAILILTTAASKGNAESATKLGHIASESEDYVKSLEYYRTAADLGEPTAMLCIGIQYLNGWGVAKDHEQALRWIQKAADHGNDDAKRILVQTQK